MASTTSTRRHWLICAQAFLQTRAAVRRLLLLPERLCDSRWTAARRRVVGPEPYETHTSKRNPYWYETLERQGHGGLWALGRARRGQQRLVHQPEGQRAPRQRIWWLRGLRGRGPGRRGVVRDDRLDRAEHSGRREADDQFRPR